jgi:DNA-binding transcriptional MerR regulator
MGWKTKNFLDETRKIVELIEAEKDRKEILVATGASDTQYDRVLFCCRHGLADKLISGEFTASALKKMVESGQLVPPVTPDSPRKIPNGLSIKQLRQAVEMLEQNQDRKTVIGSTNISGDTYRKLKVIIAARRVNDLFSGHHTVGSLFTEIISFGHKDPPPRAKKEIRKPEPEVLPSLDRLVLDGIVGIALAQKLSGVNSSLSRSFIEDISRFIAGLDGSETKDESVFRQRSDEMNAQLRELDRQIKEKEEQVRHLDREIACRRNAEAFVRQIRETMAVLRDMELALSRGDVTRENFMALEEADYHAATLRRIADVMSNIRGPKVIQLRRDQV